MLTFISILKSVLVKTKAILFNVKLPCSKITVLLSTTLSGWEMTTQLIVVTIIHIACAKVKFATEKEVGDALKVTNLADSLEQ